MRLFKSLLLHCAMLSLYASPLGKKTCFVTAGNMIALLKERGNSVVKCEVGLFDTVYELQCFPGGGGPDASP